MPPELILGKKIGEKVDSWALGCLLFEMTTGEKMLPENREKTAINHSYLLGLMDRQIRRLPPIYCQVGSKTKIYFEKNGKLKQSSGYELLSDTVPIGCLPKDPDFLQLLRSCLEYYSFRRPSPLTVLACPWIKSNLENKAEQPKAVKLRSLSDRLLGIEKGSILDQYLNDDSVMNFAESELLPLNLGSSPNSQKAKKVSQLKIGNFGQPAEDDWSPPLSNKHIYSASIDKLLLKDYCHRKSLLLELL